ncbi:hypothetical protein SUS17_2189 [Sphingomonas sp. S17]|nr:hypothetical protein SUS17_2189 [Sphingomonas sp. S17]
MVEPSTPGGHGSMQPRAGAPGKSPVDTRGLSNGEAQWEGCRARNAAQSVRHPGHSSQPWKKRGTAWSNGRFKRDGRSQDDVSRDGFTMPHGPWRNPPCRGGGSCAVHPAGRP